MEKRKIENKSAFEVEENAFKNNLPKETEANK